MPELDFSPVSFATEINYEVIPKNIVDCIIDTHSVGNVPNTPDFSKWFWVPDEFQDILTKILGIPKLSNTYSIGTIFIDYNLKAKKWQYSFLCPNYKD